MVTCTKFKIIKSLIQLLQLLSNSLIIIKFQKILKFKFKIISSLIPFKQLFKIIVSYVINKKVKRNLLQEKAKHAQYLEFLRFFLT